MPPVFDNKRRTALDRMRRGESLYTYYDRCARPGYETLRALVDCWASELPVEARNDLVARLRTNRDQEFQAALVELVTHAILRRLAALIAEGESLRRICANTAMPAMSSIMRWLFDPHPEGDPRLEFRHQYARSRARAREAAAPLRLAIAHRRRSRE